jgi:trimethylamine--corrinoid protein Co-methyltransferase
MKEGAKAGSLKLLSDEAAQRVHEAAVSLLEDPGVRSDSSLFLDVCRKGGAKVDGDSGVIRLPRDIVDWALKTAPASFVIYGRDPEGDLLAESGRVYYGMGGTAEPFFYDYDLGQPRLPTKADMVNCTRVGQALTNVDFVMTLCSAGDVPKNVAFFHEYDAIFRNTSKPMVVSVVGRKHTAMILEMAAAACGGETALRERPWGMAMVTPVSPLEITKLNEGMVEAIAFGVPVLYAPGPMMGATGPATAAGTLALTIAESLFGLVLAQMIQPGCKVILKPDPNAMDMVTAQCTYGSAEQSMARAAMAQIGRTYNLPIFTHAGGAESKMPDAEAAAQAMMGMLLDGLSGVTLTQTMGTLASGLYGSPEMAAICDEMVHMIKRVLSGVTVNDDTLAVDVVREVGHGRHFMDHDHTIKYFRQELFFPVLFRRQSVEQWKARGAKNITQVARERVLEILSKAGPVPMVNGADAALKDALRRAIAETEKMAADA